MHRKWLAAVGAALALFASAVPAAPPAAARVSHTITWDQHSLRVDGAPFVLWSGEFAYWRLPDPNGWRDVFQKMRAGGFNAVSIYFDWGYHSPAPGVYDFHGVRNVDRVLDEAARAGLYVIARPGPYINAETDGGGMPAWLAREPVVPRTDDPAYVAFALQWLSHIDPIIARHQLTNGTGSVLLYQVENEFHNDSAQAEAYMTALEGQARSDGITVPTDTNETGWAHGTGAVDIPAGIDEYPLGFNCASPATWAKAPTLRREDPNKPAMIFEYGSGSFDPWGGSGYANCAQLTNADYEDVFYKDALAQGMTGLNFYMAFGGTSWGWLPTTRVYSSYDYGAPITESRQLTTKYDELKRLGYLVRSVAPLATADLVSRAPLAADTKLLETVRADATTGTTFYYLRHADATSTANDATALAISTADGTYPAVPVQVNGRDSRLLVADYNLPTAHLVYSTSELMTAAGDAVLLYGNAGEPGETVLRYAAQPQVTVLSGSVASAWNPTTGDLTLDYTHGGLARVRVTGGGRSVLLLLADYAASAAFWQFGGTLVSGPELVRSASTDEETLRLTGDTSTATTLEVFTPIRELSWNGREVEARRTASGSVIAQLPGPRSVTLPALTNWRFMAESPEASAGFDDSSWVMANGASLDEDFYGFHHGDVWYRGHATASGTETAIAIDGEGGSPGIWSAWLNGMFLGTAPSGAHSFAIPAGLLQAGADNVVSVLVQDNGHEECRPPCGHFFDARGLKSAAFVGASTPIAWRIQGNRGGESAPITAQGPLNLGGLFGERNGWYQPRFNDRRWAAVSLPDAWAARGVPAGIGWYRTSFRLDLPEATDVPISLGITDDPARHYRAEIFLNGWMVGLYANDVGPQHAFVLPAGLLNRDGSNSIAIAVWGEDAVSGGLGQVALVTAGKTVSSLDGAQENDYGSDWFVANRSNS